jgi:hypothetical protein
LEGKKMNRNKALTILTIISLSLAAVLTIPIHAVTLSGITPDQGPVGTEVRLIGTIDTMGGAYAIWFDVDGNGTAVEDTLVKTGFAPASSYEVNTTFIVPPCAATDIGEEYKVTLRDNTTENTLDTTFTVETSRNLVVTEYVQEGENIEIKMEVTGGVADTLNNFTVAVTDPAGTESMNYNISFTTDANGSGYNVTSFPADYLPDATSNFTGTYAVVANRTLPGEITDAATASFEVGLTNASSYVRFETVNVKTSGWAPNQNITVIIQNPSMENVSVWENVNATDGTWTGNWMIPVGAALGTYTVEVVNATGEDKAVASVQTFTVQSATLKVMVTEQPEVSYMRTETVTAEINITYPDDTFYTDAELGTILVRVYQDTTNVANVSLIAEDFNATTNEWTVSWVSPWNATLADNYRFVVKANEVVDDNNPNKGPATDVSTDDFELLATDLNVDKVYTTKSSYVQGDVVTVYFNSTYQNGTPVTTGSAPINMTMANGTSTQLTATYVLANSRFEAKYTLTTEDPTGTWTALLEAQVLEDAEGNNGPSAAKTAEFTVTELEEEEEIAVSVKITPQSLNLKSKGNWVMAHIKVSGANTSDVDTSSILLNGVIEPDEVQVCGNGQVLVKFDRSEVQDYIKGEIDGSNKFSNIDLTISGMIDGEQFEDTDSIKVKK